MSDHVHASPAALLVNCAAVGRDSDELVSDESTAVGRPWTSIPGDLKLGSAVPDRDVAVLIDRDPRTTVVA